MVHSITLRAIETLSDADLDFRPQPDMRSVRDLIQHIYGMQKSFANGIKAGRLSQEIENANIPESSEGKSVSGRSKDSCRLRLPLQKTVI